MKALSKILGGVLMLLLTLQAIAADASDNQNNNLWFESFKQTATDAELYRFLYQMPKGGDLHNHLSGSGFPEWWYEGALAQKDNGYVYYTKITINNCRQYGHNAFGFNRYYLMFRNITEGEYQQLDECEQSEYKPLADLTADERVAWEHSIRLDKLHEGRNEFFETHWQRLNALVANPHLMAEILVKNMQAFSQEGLLYLETQAGGEGYFRPDGSRFEAHEVADIYRARLQQKDAKATGLTVRFQSAILRFLPNAELALKDVYKFVHDQDLWLAVNMVGREDNDKGYPLRFLPTLRELRRQYPGVKLAIHAGEVDEPNHHIRDTLLLGAERIGHGLNLISDPETLVQMRHGPYLVEINLISNLLLEYVSDYSQHPFPEYLRLGVPVALSTDDRGMWDSRITDEFFVAVKEFNLSWAELVSLNQNSLAYGFMDNELKQELLKTLDKRSQKFIKSARQKGGAINSPVPNPRGFICSRYQLCEL